MSKLTSVNQLRPRHFMEFIAVSQYRFHQMYGKIAPSVDLLWPKDCFDNDFLKSKYVYGLGWDDEDVVRFVNEGIISITGPDGGTVDTQGE